MLAAVSLVLLAAPASGQAAVTLGTVAHQPNGAVTQRTCAGPDGCTFVPFMYASGAPVSSPFDGVITKWRVFATDYTYTVRLRVFAHPDFGTYIPKRTGIAEHPMATLQDVSSFTNYRMPIDAGEVIAVQLIGATQKIVVEKEGLGSTDGAYGGAISDGTTYPPPSFATWELELEATVEPDADHDGFGDETQDGCPTDPSTQAACPPGPPGGPGSGGLGGGLEGLDVSAPTFVGKVKANPKSFAVDPKGKAEQPVSAATKGTTLEFTLSEAATVTFLVERPLPGRLVKGKCKAQTKANRAAKPCKRYKRVGAFRGAGVAGVNRKPFSGRIGKKSLTPGSYRVTLTATDAAGNRSQPQTLSLQVLKPSKRKH